MSAANSDVSEQKEDDKKKLIVISGITSGIGAGMLRKFSKLGYVVAGFGRTKENILALRKELNMEDELLLSVVDITKEEEVTKWAQSVIEKHGTPYMVIHNAGSVVGCNKDTWELDMTELATSLNIHIGGAVLMAKCFMPCMREANRGMFINISSWAGQNGYAGGTPYCSSKFAIEGLTQCLAKELVDLNPENQVLACCVSPGFVNTGMLKGSFSEQIAKQNNVENGDEWAEKTCEWILGLNAVKDEDGGFKYHGKSIGCPLEKVSMKKYCDAFEPYGVKLEYNKYIHEPNFDEK